MDTFLRRKPKENVLDIIAGCSVLKPDSTNGFAWGNATLKQSILKGLCGYHGRAPSDKRGKSVSIAKDFTAFLSLTQIPPILTHDYVLDAWLEANRKNSALGIVYNSSQSWKIQRVIFGEEKVEGPFPW